MPVERHRRHVEALGERGHRERVEFAFVGKRESFREHPRAIDSSRSSHTRKYMAYTYFPMIDHRRHRVARRPSRTAQLMAVQRGLESARPAPTRLFHDPFAERFVVPAWRV